MCVKTFLRRTVVQMWKAEPEYAGSRVQGEDCGNVAFVKQLSSSLQIANIKHSGALTFVSGCSSVRPRPRIGCFLAECAFPQGVCRDTAAERAFCHDTCRDAAHGRPLIDIWRASPCLPALCVYPRNHTRSRDRFRH